MNKTGILVSLMIVMILAASCSKKQDLVQKAFSDKNFDTMLEKADQSAPAVDDDKKGKEDTKIDVLIDNLPDQKDAESVFTETGSTERVGTDIFKVDPDAPTVKFDEIELYEVVRTLLNILEVSYIIDPALKDQAITLDIKDSDNDFKTSDLLDLILKLHDLTMVVHENYVHIVPIDNPEVNPGLRLLHGNRPNKNLRKEELVIQLIPLKYVAAAEISAVIKDFLSPTARILEEPKNNVLIIIDKYQYIAKAMDLIPVFDVDVLANKKMVFYQMAFVDATETATRLQEILGVYGYDTDGERLSVVPIDTLNGILVVSNSTNIFKELDFWIDKFDKEAQFEEDQVFVYNVENTTADTIAYTLSQIYGIQTSGGFGSFGASSRRSTSPGGFGGNTAGGRNNQNTNNQNNLQNRQGQTNQTNQTNQQGAFNNNNRAGFNNRTGGRFGGAGRNNNNADPEAPQMVVDEDNNSLIFLTTPREYSRINKTLKKLDILPRQVFLEVSVLSVELNDTFNFGINWSATNDPAVRTNPDNNIDSAGFQSPDTGNPFFSGTYTYVGSATSIIASLNAAKTKGYVNVLQQPHIMAIDNKPASISVGTDIPIATATTNLNNIATGGSNTPATSSTIQYRSTGVTLDFTPHINANGVIRIEVALNISTAGAQSGSEAVPISQNTLTTEMIVRDAQTAIMGGLIFNQEDKSKSTVPFLGRIPLLKHLFTTRNATSARQELVVMITPRLIDSEEKQLEISREFKEKILKEFETFKHNE